jgi:tetratricopeptide (TPR) repeat protein
MTLHVTRREMLALALLMTAAGGAFHWYETQTGKPASGGVIAEATPNTAGHEDEWIVGQVARDLGQLMAYAAAVERGNAKAEPPAIKVTLAAAPTGVPEERTWEIQAKPANGALLTDTLTMSGTPWGPEAYQPWLQKLGAAWKVTAQPAPASAPASVVELLTTPTVKNFLQANTEISAGLTQSPGTAVLHEEAALLLGALAWSEAAGNFSDPRGMLNAAAAHLAMAQWLRAAQAPSLDGRLAATTLLMLTGRQAEATQQVEALAKEPNLPAAAQEWVAALRLGNFGDWRTDKPGKEASFLWRRAYYRNVLQDISPDPEAPDWARIALGWTFSVQVGNVFTSRATRQEMAEIQELMAAYGLKATQGLDALLGVKDSGPWADGGITVVPQGMWGARAQRHLFAALAETYYHLEEMLGVSSEAAQFRNAAAQVGGGNLALRPLLDFYLAGSQANYDQAMQAVATLVREHPELVTAANWRAVRLLPEHWNNRNVVPAYNGWFTPWVPPGTTYDTVNRYYFDEVQNQSAETFEAWRKLAPLKGTLALGLLHAQYGDDPTPEEAEAALSPMKDYNLPLAMRVADTEKDNPDQYAEAMKAVCAMDPQQYMELGRHLEDGGHYDAAAVAYQKGVDLAPDRVGVANEMEFLVKYYYDHGDRDRALKVAQMAADVYSYSGLAVLARLYLWMGKYPEALGMVKQMQDRYGGTDLGVVVYDTWAKDTGEAAAKTAADAGWKEYFPKGLEPVKLADMAQAPPPTDGVQLLEGGYFLTHNGLDKGDVVVGINGQRVRNLSQYSLLLDLPRKVEYDILYWHNGQYGEGKMYLPDRRFNVDASTYRGKNAGKDGPSL